MNLGFKDLQRPVIKDQPIQKKPLDLRGHTCTCVFVCLFVCLFVCV